MTMKMKFILLMIGYATLSQAQEKIKPLQIGDACPDLDLSFVNYTSPSAKLSDFRGKALILDFWATWCAPCVGSIPKMDSLQKQFSDRLTILPVTYEDKNTVAYLVNKLSKIKKIHFFSVVADQKLNLLFPHATVPHHVWIDANGIVQAMTYPEELTAANLAQFTRGEKLNLPLRSPDPEKNADIAAIHTVSGLLSNQGGFEFGKSIGEDSTIESFHMLSKYNPGFSGGANHGHKNWIAMPNSSISSLFAIAYGEGIKFFGGRSRMQIFTGDSVRFFEIAGPGRLSPQYRWMWRSVDGHLYNYFLKIPLKDSARLFETMRREIDSLFPFVKASVETRLRPCLVLKQIPGNESFKSKDEGPGSYKRTPFYLTCNRFPMSSFFLLIKISNQDNPLPLLDNTNYSGNVDLDLQAELNKPEELNRALNKYGLELVQENRPVDILVLRDLRDQ
jgi:thiol-disulfide isomerase/thioredoxin